MVDPTFVPLILAVVLLMFPVLAGLNTRVDQLLSRISMAFFGGYVSEHGRKPLMRRARLRAAHYQTAFRVYAAKTYFLAMLGALVAGLLGMYVIWGILIILAIDEETIRATVPSQLDFLANFVGVPFLTIGELFVLVTVTSLTLGALAGLGTYWWRWWYPGTVAEDRRKRIEATLPGAVAFIYALSRSGMEFPEVLRTLARNREIYGETSQEASVAVRHMDLFGMDVISATQLMARRAPSPKFKEFGENLASVLQSGRNLSSFLRRQYEEYTDEAESQQEQLLELLSTLAEMYVTVFVAGPLFMITILVVIGMTLGETLQPLRVLIYVILPLANLVFMLYLHRTMGTLNPKSRLENETATDISIQGVPEAVKNPTPTLSDGGEHKPTPNEERLESYRKIRWLRQRIGQPVRTVIDRPMRIFWVTGPLAFLLLLVRFYRAGFDLSPTVIDDFLIQAGLFLIGTFAIAYEVHKRRINAIESAVPDFLDRFASVNEAGMTVVESLNRVRGSELGALDEELERIWRDIQWGADVKTALFRFERRIRTRMVARVVTLITKAMNASGDLATVLRIAAAQAKADRRLKRERRQEMLTYLVVVYVAFGVFLFIIVILNLFLIPNVTDASLVGNASAGGAQNVPSPGGVGNTGEVNADAFKLLFFHTGILQALLSGFVAGQLSTGDIRGGAKHAAIMTGLAYTLFFFMF